MLFNVPLSSREDIVLLAEEVLLARDVPHGGRLRVHVEWPDKVAVDVCRPIEVRQHQPEHQDQLCVRPNGKPETHYWLLCYGRTNLYTEFSGGHSITIPFYEFGEGKLEEGDERVENPVGEPLLVIGSGLSLYSLYRSIPVQIQQIKETYSQHILMIIFNQHELVREGLQFDSQVIGRAFTPTCIS